MQKSEIGMQENVRGKESKPLDDFSTEVQEIVVRVSDKQKSPLKIETVNDVGRLA